MFLNGEWLSERITAFFVSMVLGWSRMTGAVILYGNNIIKDLDCANFFGEKFGSVEDLIILYP